MFDKVCGKKGKEIDNRWNRFSVTIKVESC